MKRRTFMVGGVLGLGGVLLHPNFRIRAATGERVIVIGAGISGITAASKLASSGYDVVVLEARNRIGGRIWTDTSLGEEMDLGASWIHGSSPQNPITQLAQQYGITTVSTENSDAVYFNSRGRQVRSRQISRMSDIWSSIAGDAVELGEELNSDAGLGRLMNRVMRSEYRGLRRKQKQMINWITESNVTVAAGEEATRLSTWFTDDDEGFESPSSDEVIFPDGYIQIPNALANGLTINLDHVVSSISYDTGGVTVETNQGAFQGDRVVVTLPLGVLKAGSVTFSPALPADKLTAIAGLGFGVLNKVVLKFPSIFWQDGTSAPGFIGNVRKVRGAKEEITEFLNVSDAAGAPYLMGFTGGDFARTIEALSLEEVQELAMRSLRRMFGGDIPDPTGVLRTAWVSDPYAGGAYSHIPVDGLGSYYTELGRSVENRLFFAGEHTTREYPATVHGAYLSGQTAADAIIAIP